MSEVAQIVENSAENAAVESQPPKQEGAATKLAWMEYAINAAIAMVVMAVALLAYHQLVVAPNKQRFAYVDISELMELKELQVAGAAMAPGATDADRERAFGEIAKFASDLERAISTLQSECDCTLLVRAAIVKSKSEDMTPVLKERLGMANLDKDSLMKAIRGTSGSSQSGAKGIEK